MGSHLYEVQVRNRVVKGLGLIKISGTQGNWYQEELFFIAESKAEVERMAWKKVKKRRILGIPKRTKRSLNREVEILNTRRIA